MVCVDKSTFLQCAAMLRLRDEQRERIREYLPGEHIPEGRAGRKPVPAWAVLEAVLWILNAGEQWHMLPQCYPNYTTVHQRFQPWCKREVLRDILRRWLNTLREEGELVSARAHPCDVRLSQRWRRR